jgi:hypothetical protein
MLDSGPDFCSCGRAGFPVSTELPAGKTRFPLYAEDLTVSKRQIAGDRVQVSTVTREGSILVDEALNHVMSGEGRKGPEGGSYRQSLALILIRRRGCRRLDQLRIHTL